jgi:predicted kinase
VTYVVIVTGPPASGKSTLAGKLAADLQIPLFSKDGFKETLFDSLGWEDRAWSRKLGVAGYHLLNYTVGVELAAGRSVMIEANFDPRVSSAALLDIYRRFPFHAVQIVCRAEVEVLKRRFLERDATGVRHPGHVDTQAFAELLESIQRSYGPLDLPGTAFEVETNDLDAVDYEELRRKVRHAIRPH